MKKFARWLTPSWTLLLVTLLYLSLSLVFLQDFYYRTQPQTTQIGRAHV